MPNVIAGVLIGIGNTSWTTVVGALVGWGVVWIVWSVVRKSPWITAHVLKGIEVKGWTPARAWVSALFIEYMTATSTALPFGCITFLIKGWITP